MVKRRTDIHEADPANGTCRSANVKHVGLTDLNGRVLVHLAELCRTAGVSANAEMWARWNEWYHEITSHPEHALSGTEDFSAEEREFLNALLRIDAASRPRFADLMNVCVESWHAIPVSLLRCCAEANITSLLL